MTEVPNPDRIPITVEISPTQKRRIERLAEQKDLSPDAIVRAAIDHELAAAAKREEIDGAAQSESFLEATQDLAGSVKTPDAPRDLSSNPKHMEGYGE